MPEREAPPQRAFTRRHPDTFKEATGDARRPFPVGGMRHRGTTMSDGRLQELQTILHVYLTDTAGGFDELDRRRKGVIDAHAGYGPSSVVANQALGQFYFMISELRHRIHRLDRSFQAYIKQLEDQILAKGSSLNEECQRLKVNVSESLVKSAKAAREVELREEKLAKISGTVSEKEYLSQLALKYTDETNHTLILNQILSIYADYVEKLEGIAGLETGFIKGDDESASRLSRIFIGLENQFEFELEKPCPRCKETVHISPQAPKFMCPFCGSPL